jgi:hypothetical protein
MSGHRIGEQKIRVDVRLLPAYDDGSRVGRLYARREIHGGFAEKRELAVLYDVGGKEQVVRRQGLAVMPPGPFPKAPSSFHLPVREDLPGADFGAWQRLSELGVSMP